MEDFYGLSDLQIQKKIGDRVRAARLKQNVTQESLAQSTSVSRSSIKKIEKGEIGSFESLLRVLRSLGLLDDIHGLLEEPQLSPSEYYDVVNSLNKNKRKRASGRIDRKEEAPEW